MRKVLLLLCLAFSTGCISTSSYHTARPIEAGTTEIGLAVEGATSLGDSSVIVVTRPRVMARRGLTEQSDFGISGGPSGTSFDYNYMVFDAAPFVLSINPTVYLNYEIVTSRDSNNDSESAMALVPFLGILADLELSEQATITFGFKPGFYRQSESSGGQSAAETSAIVAGSLGMRLETGPVALLPEINLIYSLEEGSEPLLTFGLGVSF